MEPNILAGVPSIPLPERLYRVFRRSHSDAPWYFASVPDDPNDEGGRFDLPAPMGTMHTATSEVAAMLETFLGHLGPLESLDVAELRTRLLGVIDVPSTAPDAADLTHPSVVGTYAVTATLWAGSSRAMSQTWAFALRRDGWWSMHVGIQHDPTGSLRGVAVFDHTGEHPPNLGDRPWGHTNRAMHTDTSLLDQLAQHGVRVRGRGILDTPTVP